MTSTQVSPLLGALYNELINKQKPASIGTDHVDGAALLDDLVASLTKYVIFPSAEIVDAVALWIAATHAQPAWQHGTRLVLKSPEKRCGKSRVLDIIGATCHRPLMTVNASVAAVFRSIDSEDPPTLLIDEADAIFGRKAADGVEELRGLLNAGFGRGRPAIRCVGFNQTPTEFNTYAMAALAAIGDVIPDTITDRAVNVLMRRRAPHERVAPYRHRRDAVPLRALGDRLGAWLRAHLDDLEHAEPAVPVEDRAADLWEPLIAVADLAGRDWPARARRAATTITNAADQAASDESTGRKLLFDLRQVTADCDKPAIASADLVQWLHQLADSPWSKFDFTQSDLARRLRLYDIRPRQVRPDGNRAGQVRGYMLDELRDVFTRYLSIEHEDDNDDVEPVEGSPASHGVTPSQSQVKRVTAEQSVTRDSVTRPEAVTALIREGDGVTGGDTILAGDDHTSIDAALERLERELDSEVIQPDEL
jgi:hypothetical protein